MATINAGTKLSVPKKTKIGGKAASSKSASKMKRGSAPPLPTPVLHDSLEDCLAAAFGQERLVLDGRPHTASTTRDRAQAAANVAGHCLHNHSISSIIPQLVECLVPRGIPELLKNDEEATLKPSASAVSLSSLALSDDMSNTVGTDAHRTPTPANAREGALLILRALCQIVGRPAQAYVVGAFLLVAWQECASHHAHVRQAAQDTAQAILELANPYAYAVIVWPLLQLALDSNEWRTKVAALEGLATAAAVAPLIIHDLIPDILPRLTLQIGDTKLQVSQASKTALLAVCNTNTNRDIQPAIPSIVHAIGKPSATNKAVEELMATTFVVPINSSTLSMLCPILARALKEKLALSKRNACIVISNMSKLVESPQAIAPFGHLLVPELQKVSQNVQFDEIRDQALQALQFLTKALGDAYESQEAILQEQERVKAEQAQIEQERLEQEAKAQAVAEAELIERRRFKEAMEAQRELDKMEAEKTAEEKEKANRRKEAAKLSTKGGSGKCQGCGLKKCKKSCMFSSG